MSTYRIIFKEDSLTHYGIKGQKWGVRRYQNEDGSLTAEGRKRYGNLLEREKKEYDQESLRTWEATKRYKELERSRISDQVTKRDSIFKIIKMVIDKKKTMEITREEIEKGREKIDEILEKSKDFETRRAEINAKLKENKELLKHPEQSDDASLANAKQENESMKKDLREMDNYERRIDRNAQKMAEKVTLFDEKKVRTSFEEGPALKDRLDYIKKHEKEILKNGIKALNEYVKDNGEEINSFKPGFIWVNGKPDNKNYFFSGETTVKGRTGKTEPGLNFNIWFYFDDNKGLIPTDIDWYD